MPSISTIAPVGTDSFFEKLLEVKRQFYSNGNFQMQFSIHSTNMSDRFKLVPVKTWSFKKMAAYGEEFFSKNDRKITLNFAAVQSFEINPSKLKKYFSPEIFIIKLTPVNPTENSISNNIKGVIDPDKPESANDLIASFHKEGYDVILSIGETEENKIGSNCGMFVNKLMRA